MADSDQTPTRNAGPRFATELEPVIAFVVRDRFYIGPEDEYDPCDENHVSLEPPDLPLWRGKFIRVADVVGKETALSDYYRRVVEVAKEHHKVLKPDSPYFWMRFVLHSNIDEAQVVFPWWDHLEPISVLVNALEKDDDGLLYDDMDQCWQVEFIGNGSDLVIVQAEPVEVSVTTSRNLIVRRLREELDTAAAAVHSLAEHTGMDIWSESKWNEVLRFRFK